MLRDARMTQAINFEKLTIDKRVLGVDVEDARAELAQVHHGINALANQVARVPLNAQVLATGFIEETFPHRGLRKHVEAHDGQMIGTHRAMLKRDANAFISSDPP